MLEDINIFCRKFWQVPKYKFCKFCNGAKRKLQEGFKSHVKLQNLPGVATLQKDLQKKIAIQKTDLLQPKLR